MIGLDNTLVGIGLYTAAEASQLSNVPLRSIRRWMLGYSYSRHGDTHHQPAVWNAGGVRVDGTLGLTFLDLMEVRFVKAFRDAGVSWKVIRTASERAQKYFSQSHPFATQRFRTDGRGIFAEILDESGEKTLLDLFRSQFAFHRVVSPSLYAGLEFTANDQVARWFPLPRSKQIVIDPLRAFGQPIINATGVPTAVLAHAAKAEGSRHNVAKWYDVPLSAVNAAVRYQRSIEHRLAN